MRRLKQLVNEFDAARILTALRARNIEVQLSKNEDLSWDIWVVDEDHHAEAINVANAALQETSPIEQKSVSPSIIWRAQQAAEIKAKKPRPRSRSVSFIGNSSLGSLTLAIMATCVILTFGLRADSLSWLHAKFYFSEFYGNGFPEILQGQIWRIWTPIFLHGGVFHLLMNMLMFMQEGAQIEQQEGAKGLGILVIGIGACVNTAQYLVSGPAFGGMSGVLYALLGYIWMMASFSRKFNYMMTQETVIFAVVWMVLCFTGLLGNIANTQHVVGFILGIVIGYTRSGELALKIRQFIRKRRN